MTQEQDANFVKKPKIELLGLRGIAQHNKEVKSRLAKQKEYNTNFASNETSSTYRRMRVHKERAFESLLHAETLTSFDSGQRKFIQNNPVMDST